MRVESEAVFWMASLDRSRVEPPGGTGTSGDKDEEALGEGAEGVGGGLIIG